MAGASRLPPAAGLLLALLAGLAVPVQARANGALGARMNDSLGAALASIAVGLVCIGLVTVLLPSGRAGARQFLPALRERRFPRWYVLAGGIGGYFVLTQSLTVGLLGVAVFTVATVAGQTLTGLLVDRIGMGPAGRKPVTAARAAGAVLTIAAVAWALSPKLDGGSPADLLLPVLLPLTAGMLISFQQAMNGTTSVQYGTSLTATLVNLVVGTAVLLICWLVKSALWGFGGALPTEWYLYLGGPLGVCYVGLGAMLVRHLGVLLTGLGMICGQLIGSLLLDAVLPAAGSGVGAATIAGTALTLAAMVLATLPWSRPKVRR
ncbi:DMT family transporter [Arthrobacter sp. zg-Y1219]|uniref:DMT family transporter n=1 Tax=Arthrobacter sp. zg-Y1219 TaxID=3049067 RepID=UPI0024C38EC1|nr:DMT family transporter [Arthrobacter sp. zg-Y1219]MDK1360282.1 DMT family transporter [Arthrobacter sp. zg-Y1219]